jgi:hypothetical protein
MCFTEFKAIRFRLNNQSWKKLQKMAPITNYSRRNLDAPECLAPAQKPRLPSNTSQAVNRLTGGHFRIPHPGPEGIPLTIS